eukprot:s1791_g9.t1
MPVVRVAASSLNSPSIGVELFHRHRPRKWIDEYQNRLLPRCDAKALETKEALRLLSFGFQVFILRQFFISGPSTERPRPGPLRVPGRLTMAAWAWRLLPFLAAAGIDAQSAPPKRRLQEYNASNGTYENDSQYNASNGTYENLRVMLRSLPCMLLLRVNNASNGTYENDSQYNASNGTYENGSQAVQSFAQQTPFPVSCFTACPELALLNNSFAGIYDELSDASPKRTIEYLEAFATFGERVSALFCQHRDLAACIANNPASCDAGVEPNARRLKVRSQRAKPARKPGVAARKPPVVVETQQIRRAVQSRLLQAGYGGYGTGTTGGYGGYSGNGTGGYGGYSAASSTTGGYGGYSGTGTGGYGGYSADSSTTGGYGGYSGTGTGGYGGYSAYSSTTGGYGGYSANNGSTACSACDWFVANATSYFNNLSTLSLDLKTFG